MKNLILVIAAICFLSGAYAQADEQNSISSGREYALNTKGERQRTARGWDAIEKRTDEVSSSLADDEGLRRIISKTFPVDRNAKVNLSNQFGSILIKVWDRNEVKIDIDVIARGNSEKVAQRLLDEVNISLNKTGDLISSKTTIDRNNGWGRSKTRNVKVQYVVYMPAINALTVFQEFGNINIGNFAGALSARVEYGNFVAGNLSGTNNYIYVQYGKSTITELNKGVVKHEYGAGVVLGTVGTLDLDAQYVNVNIGNIRGDAIVKQQYGEGFTLGGVNNLDLDIQYATANIGTIRGNATIKQEYNSIKISSVGKLTINAEYTGVTIGTLRGDGNFNLSYDHLRVNEVGSGCKLLNVDAEYVDINLGFAPGYSADFILNREYGSFKYGTNVRARVESDDEDSFTKRYLGRIGNGGGASIRIKNEYGSVVFK